MAHFQNPDLEYVVDDYYDMTDFEEDTLSETDTLKNGSVEAMDSDVEDNFEMVGTSFWEGFPSYAAPLRILWTWISDFVTQSKPKTDTSAEEFRNGKDIQGIPWDRLNFTRDKYRETRLKQYKNYENLSRPREELEKVSLICRDKIKMYLFHLSIFSFFFFSPFLNVEFGSKGLHSYSPY